ncbi:MAG: hypothetical protein DRP01_01740 [Archaeoglobales archaeon]|nr:MAG: hypothetical protein DRP01_01740 [Archaeoglobales archaeon]
MGWLTGWKYRKSHIINSASDAGQNYQIRITVHYGSGDDNGEDVYLNTKCKPDFGDIRFTSDDGSALLSSWREKKIDSDYAIFWVKIADNLSSKDVTIYIYYGKEDATYPYLSSDQEHGEATFVFFDNFEDNNFDDEKWQTWGNGGNVNEENGKLIVTSGKWANENRFVATKNIFPVPLALEAKVRRGNEYHEVCFGMCSHDQINNNNIINKFYSAPFDVRPDSDKISYINGNDVNATIGHYSFDEDTEPHRVTLIRMGTDYDKFFCDGEEKSVGHTTSVDRHIFAFAERYHGQSIIELDWVAVRKYAEPEPSHGTWGSEQGFFVFSEILSLTTSLEITLSKTLVGVFLARVLLGINYVRTLKRKFLARIEEQEKGLRTK